MCHVLSGGVLSFGVWLLCCCLCFFLCFVFAFSTRHVFGVPELRNARLMERVAFYYSFSFSVSSSYLSSPCLSSGSSSLLSYSSGLCPVVCQRDVVSGVRCVAGLVGTKRVKCIANTKRNYG